MASLLDGYLERAERKWSRDPRAMEWLKENWAISACVSLCYVILVFCGRRAMASVKPFDLRIPLFLWNAFLSAFSFVIAYRGFPVLFGHLSEFGFVRSLCDAIDANPVFRFWGFVFCWSKVLELGDTAFIVLRKKPLVLLHWYHHCTTLVFSWFLYVENAMAGVWFMCQNAAVHALMYAYFAAKCTGARVPRWTAMLVTVSQILQMIGGLVVTFGAAVSLVAEDRCGISVAGFLFDLCMYGPFLLMFVDLFRRNYVIGSTSPIRKRM